MPGIPPIGKLHKLTIKAYDTLENAEGGVSATSSTSVGASSGDTFVAFYNPESATSAFTIVSDEKTSNNNTANAGIFQHYNPGTFGFELLFDGTGASVPAGVSFEEVKSSTYVANQITQLKNVVYYYKGAIHRPRYLTLIWGLTYVEICVLTSLSVTYTMFHPDGNPLRAKVKCDFKEASSIDLRKGQQDKKSPDITHVHTVKAGDHLPLLCNRVYGDPKLYLQVAKFNNLRNHRSLEPGQKLYFPPLINIKS